MPKRCERKRQPQGQVHPDRARTVTLEHVNRALMRYGFCPRPGLPQGVPGMPQDCAIHRALRPLGVGMTVGHKFLVTSEDLARGLAICWGTQARVCTSDRDRGRWEVPLPGELRTFIKTFDAEKYEDLIDDEAVAARAHEAELAPGLNLIQPTITARESKLSRAVLQT